MRSSRTWDYIHEVSCETLGRNSFGTNLSSCAGPWSIIAGMRCHYVCSVSTVRGALKCQILTTRTSVAFPTTIMR